MSGTLKLSLLGTFHVVRCGAPIRHFAADSARALLAYLAVQPGVPHSRERLADLLWHDQPRPQGQTNLRTALNRLRGALSDKDAANPLIVADRKSILFDSDHRCSTDVWHFAQLLDTVAHHAHVRVEDCPTCYDRLKKAAALYRGELLAGFYFNSLPFEEWLSEQRAALQDQMVRALQLLVAYSIAHGAHDQAVVFARRLVDLTPWHEEGHHQLMRALFLSNRRGEALAHYAIARRNLMEELGIAPGPALEQLYLQLQEGRLTAAPVALAANPYQGLEPFSEAQVAYFFGRAALITQVATLLESQSVMALIGASGSGKSSFIHAGLIPFLTKTRRGPKRKLTHTWRVVHLRPGQTPFLSLAQALLPFLPDEIIENELAAALRAAKCTLAAVAHALCRQPPSGQPKQAVQLLIIVDQFEELFTLVTAPEERKAFLECLLAHLYAPGVEAAPFRVLLSLRADFMSQALQYRPLVDAIQDRTVVIGPMNRNEIWTAIEEPARMNGVTYEPGLVERLLDDVGEEAGRLPLLEFALTLLWDRQHNGWITHKAYGEIGRVTGALTRYADAFIAQLNADEQQRMPHILSQLVQPGHGSVDTRRLARASEFSDADWALVQKLANARLVVTNQDANGEETAEMAHESLIEAWHQLQEWLRADQAFRLWQWRVGDLAQSWRASGEDNGFLLRGAPLTEAEQWFVSRGDQLSRATLAFIDASLTWRKQQIAAENERRQRELAQAQSLRAALDEAEKERDEAKRQARLALSRQLSVQAILAAKTRPDLAVLLSLESLRRTDQIADVNALFSHLLLDHRLERYLFHSANPIWSLAVANNGERVVIANEAAQLWIIDQQAGASARRVDRGEATAAALSVQGERAAQANGAVITLWDLTTGQVIAELSSHQATIQAMRFSGDGRRLFTDSGEGALLIWDSASGRLLKRVEYPQPSVLRAVNRDGSRVVAYLSKREGVLAYVFDIASGVQVGKELAGPLGVHHELIFSPDDRLVAATSFDGKTWLWDAESGDLFGTPLAGYDGRVLSVAFSPDSRLLATGGTDNRILLWDVATSKLVQSPLLGHSNWVRALLFLPDGQTLIAADADGSVLRWRLDRQRILAGHTARVREVALSPNGRTLVTGGFDGRLIVWDGQTGQAQRTIVTPHTNAIIRVKYSPDGHTVATADATGHLIFWSPVDWQPRHNLAHMTEEFIIGMTFRPDSNWLATGDFAGHVYLWQVAQGELIAHWPAHHGWAMSLTFAPDGSVLASGSTTGEILLWRLPVTTGPIAPFRALSGHTNWVNDLIFTPDGAQLVSAGGDHTIRIWDIASGKQVGNPLTGHDSQVWSLLFDHSRPQLTLVSLGSNGRVLWWDFARRALIAPALETGAESEAMVLSPDGRRLYLGTFGPNAHMWTPPPFHWKKRAHWLANRNLTPDETRHYLVNVP